MPYMVKGRCIVVERVSFTRKEGDEIGSHTLDNRIDLIQYIYSKERDRWTDSGKSETD